MYPWMFFCRNLESSNTNAFTFLSYFTKKELGSCELWRLPYSRAQPSHCPWTIVFLEISCLRKCGFSLHLFSYKIKIWYTHLFNILYWNCIWSRNFLHKIRRGPHMCVFRFSWLKLLRRGQREPGKWDDVTVWKTDLWSTHGCLFNHSFTWTMSSFIRKESYGYGSATKPSRVLKTFIFFFYKNKDVGILFKYFSVSLMAQHCRDFDSAAWLMK